MDGDIATPTVTPTATQTTVRDGGAAVDALEIAGIHADAEGDGSENLNDEYIVFENTGSEPLDIGGWTVSDSVGQTYSVIAFGVGVIFRWGRRFVARKSHPVA